jgi:glycosyltransferase involved in cell wall biosynthesis
VKISALLCAYNRLGYLSRALESVYRQKREDMEVVLVDDASTDGTGEWVRARRFPRLRYFRQPKNMGPASARNKALLMARGSFAAFLDSDDLWYEGYLKSILPAFATPAVRAAYCDYDVIGPTGKIVTHKAFVDPKRPGGDVIEALSGLKRFPLLSTCVFRRKTLLDAGGFDPGLRRLGEDVDLWYRVCLKWGGAGLRFVPRVLAAHRRHSSNLSLPAWKKRGSSWEQGWGLGARLSPEDRERVLDVAYLYHKHASWAEPLLNRA